MSYLNNKNYKGGQRSERGWCFVPLLVLSGGETHQLVVGHVVGNGPCGLHQHCPALPTQGLLFHTLPLFWLHISVALLDFSLLLSWQVITCQRERKEMILGGSLAQENVPERNNKFVTWCLNFIRVRIVFCLWLGWFAGAVQLSLARCLSTPASLSFPG